MAAVQGPANPTQVTSVLPTEYNISCSVESVYYHGDGDSKNRCAVVLEIGLHMPREERARFVDAVLCIRAPDTKLQWFPEMDEVVKVDEQNAKVKLNLAPNIQPARLVATLGASEREEDETMYKCLILRSLKIGDDSSQWEFQNDKKNLFRYFPSSVRLLLLVATPDGHSPDPFTFTLELVEPLGIGIMGIKRKRWRVREGTYSLKPCGGWKSDPIKEDYEPSMAQRLMAEYAKAPDERNASAMVGLHGAMASYVQPFGSTHINLPL